MKDQPETVWLPRLTDFVQLSAKELPALWDGDFLLGEKKATGTDQCLLCEINVCSVSPFPQSMLAPWARAMRARIDEQG